MKTYEKYKPSGIDWIGDIPEHWKVGSLKWLSKIYSGGTPDRNNLEYWTDGNIPWLNSGCVNQFKITKPSDFITEEGFKNSSAKWIDENSIVIALAGQGKTKGMSAIATFKTTGNQSLGVIKPIETYDSRYLLYYLTKNYFNIRGLAGEDNRDGLNLRIIGSITIPIFDRHEQTAIADYLDEKSAEIDKLIAKKKRLIEMLKEERTAIINQAVTKGTNADAKLKPSGIDWLGDIPENWQVKKLKYLTEKIIDNRGRTPPFGESGIPMLEVANITEGIKSPTETFQKFVEPEVVKMYEREKLQVGDLLISTVGATSGKVVIIEKEPNYFIAQNVVGFRTMKKFDSLFAFYLLKSDYFFTSLKLINKSNTIDNLKVSIFKNNYCFLPPIEEQKEIVEFIESKTNEIDSTISKIEKEIELIKEYRTALISEVVTGKIKVI